MEHDEMDTSRWVDERLSSLEPPADWRPDPSAAFAGLQRRTAPARRRWWLWATLSAGAAAACAVLLLVTAPSACANPLGCNSSGPPTPRKETLRIDPSRTTGVDMRPRQANFKESGSPTAPVTCELYTDYECPHCAVFSLETLPQFTARYVDTGKVRLIHRDFPLPRHRYARLAARYANAAGELGYYRAAADKLYRTQLLWSVDGDVDGQVAHAVPPAAMRQVRALVRDDSAAEKSVSADEAKARENRIDRTPTLICNGQVIGPNLNIGTIEASIDPLLAQR
jgi:protein-disulfide isomerase